jgi:hypothetical protein
MEMVERVARAIADKDGFEPYRDTYIRKARAAIDAMREPADAMKDTHRQHGGGGMTPADFRQWKAALGITARSASAALGIAPNTVTKYSRDGTEIPLYVALACAAVARGLKPWSADAVTKRRA